MLRSRKKDANLKPNRKLDKRSSRGMLFENEELRMRTIEINAEVERGQCDLRKLRRENQRLRRDMWALREEYERLEAKVRDTAAATTAAEGVGGVGTRGRGGGGRGGDDDEGEEEEDDGDGMGGGGLLNNYEDEGDDEGGGDDEEEEEEEDEEERGGGRVVEVKGEEEDNEENRQKQWRRAAEEAAIAAASGASPPPLASVAEEAEEGAGGGEPHPPAPPQQPCSAGGGVGDALPGQPPHQQTQHRLFLLMPPPPEAEGPGAAAEGPGAAAEGPLRMGELLSALGPAALDSLLQVSLRPPAGAVLCFAGAEALGATLGGGVRLRGRPCVLSTVAPRRTRSEGGAPKRPACLRRATVAASARASGGSGVEADESEAASGRGAATSGRSPGANRREELPWCGCWGNGCF